MDAEAVAEQWLCRGGGPTRFGHGERSARKPTPSLGKMDAMLYRTPASRCIGGSDCVPQGTASLKIRAKGCQVVHIFINYRKGGGAYAAALLDALLSERFGEDQVFRAAKSVVAGSDFAESHTESCERMPGDARRSGS